MLTLFCPWVPVARHLKEAGSAGVVVDPSKIIWMPYNAERDYATYRPL
jgi:histone acetyltransferase MYST1